jgi:hypothetical protein
MEVWVHTHRRPVTETLEDVVHLTAQTLHVEFDDAEAAADARRQRCTHARTKSPFVIITTLDGRGRDDVSRRVAGNQDCDSNDTHETLRWLRPLRSVGMSRLLVCQESTARRGRRDRCSRHRDAVTRQQCSRPAGSPTRPAPRTDVASHRRTTS